MDRKPTIAELLAVRDGDPLEAEVATRVRSDSEAQIRIDQMREIQTALRALPSGPAGTEELWREIEAWAAAKVGLQKAGLRRSRWRRIWPLGLVASVGLLAEMFLVSDPVHDQSLETSRTNIVALQQQSRLIETQLMRTSSYAGSASEQALMFRLAEVDAQLASLDDGHSLRGLRERELLWQRRIELMLALQAVQPAAQPSIQYAVY